MHTILRFTFVSLFFLPLFLQAQQYDYPKNEAALRQLQEEVRREDQAREMRVKAFLQQRQSMERSFEIDGQQYFLHDIQNGIPLYLTTHNEGAARSMRLPSVRPGGRFGLGITGAGLRVGMWDSGIALRTHQEYSTRLQNNDAGTDVSDHACHVMGTLIAAGIRDDARGMLYEGRATAYDWNQDYDEMISEAMNNNLLASNHSYGYGTGWENGVWLGDASISNQEDYRFGFYGSRSRAVDNIAFNAPYYSIFKSAGNDRGDSGNGPQPSDGPFDSVSDWGVAKNVFTIGAVRKISGEYTGPQDIIMSGFSSWGPVDDGRIKPDFVAPGVNILSSLADSDDAYGNLSGTSMASPAATGAVTAINQAYQLYYNTYLRSATLKALVAQTAFEAGNAPGPDYQFGWGMINVEAAVELISTKDDINTHIIETTLLNRDSFVLELNPVADRKITATIAWTDPPGTPVPAALDPTDLMLVNDLDMRIVDEEGNTVSPWILDPNTPGKAAGRGDNFRDNIEKIEFDNPQPRRYFLVIRHKGELRNGRQDFSLILDYTSEAPGLQNLYWINNGGDWSDDNQWSLSSGGAPAGQPPQVNSKLIFDNNSFSETESTVRIDQNYTVAGIVALNDREVTFDLQGHVLTVTGPVVMGSANFHITNGTLVLSHPVSERTFTVDLNQTRTSDLRILLDAANKATWQMPGSRVSVEGIQVQGGSLHVLNSTLNLDQLEIGEGGRFFLDDSRLEQFDRLFVAGPASWEDTPDALIKLSNKEDAVLIRAPTVDFFANLDIDNTDLTLEGNDMYWEQIVDVSAATLDVADNLGIFNLRLSGGSAVNIQGGRQLEIFQDLNIESGQNNLTRILGTAVDNRGILVFLPHEKYCYDYLDIQNVNLAGAASVSIGSNSTIVNSEGWFVGPCDELLFADFDVLFACVGALSEFVSQSDGNIAEYNWYVDEVLIGSGADLGYVFEQTGNYEVRLEIADGNGNSTAWMETINVIESEIPDNSIVQNATQLASRNPAESYQWYKNGEPIPGETGRVYLYNGEEAVYFVVTFDGDCNKRSEVLDLLGTAVENIDAEGNRLLSVYPIPTRDQLIVETKGEILSDLHLRLVNAYGQIVLQKEMGGGRRFSIDMRSYTSGIYILILDTGDQTFTKKIIKHD